MKAQHVTWSIHITFLLRSRQQRFNLKQQLIFGNSLVIIPVFLIRFKPRSWRQ